MTDHVRPAPSEPFPVQEEVGTAFRLRGVHQAKGGRPILQNVTIDLPGGRVTVLLGASGAGKSSLLRLLNRLDDPTEGTILYRGRDLTDFPVTTLRWRVGFVFQTPIVFPGTIRDNLSEAASLARVPEGEFAGRAHRVMALAELDDAMLDRPARALSVGQQQRVNIARALVPGPETLLLDEPTSALDPGTAANLLRTVRRLSTEEGLTVILATHRVEETRAAGDFAVELKDGRVVRTGSLADVLDGSRYHEGNG